MEAIFASVGPVSPAPIIQREGETEQPGQQTGEEQAGQEVLLIEEDSELAGKEAEQPDPQADQEARQLGGASGEAEAEAEVVKEKEAEPPRGAGDEAGEELEVLHWKRLYSSALDEAEKRAVADQVKYDELVARLVKLETENKDLESDKKDLEAELNAALAERTAYEDFVCRRGGMTISEAQDRVDELWEELAVLRRNNALESSACQTVVRSLRRWASRYDIVLSRRPSIERFLRHFPPTDAHTPAQTSDSLAQNPPPIPQRTQERPESSSQRRLEVRRGVVNMSERDLQMIREETLRRRGARASRARGRGGRSVRAPRRPIHSSARNTRTQLPEDFVDRWLNFSNPGL